ncbi:MAG: lasso peptide biosynthesis B2 protein, partial [Ectothiorhodospiraceae bacterium]
MLARYYRFAAEGWFAVRVAVWLCAASWRLRRQSLASAVRPAVSPDSSRIPPLPMERAVRIVLRVCRTGIFRLPFFPRPCLRRSMALCHFLARMGYPVTLHVGVRKDDGMFEGHSWVTVRGVRIGDTAPEGHFQALYEYSPLEEAAGS